MQVEDRFCLQEVRPLKVSRMEGMLREREAEAGRESKTETDRKENDHNITMRLHDLFFLKLCLESGASTTR